MLRIIKKSYGHIKKDMKTYLYNKKHFGKKVANAVFKKSFFYYLLPQKREKFEQKQEECIYAYLKNKYQYLIKEYNEKKMAYPHQKKKYIWVFWYQGVEQAPLVVKKCIKSIMEHSLDYEVVVLNEKNIKDYIKIPKIILEKVEKGIITLTHFSDILRMGLLSTHGGIWVDATCFITSNVFQKFDDVDFNSNQKKEAKWSAYFIGGKPNKVFSFCYQLLIDYNTKEDSLIEYFLVDHVLRLCYKEVYGCKEIIDGATIRNDNISNFAKKFNRIYEPKEYKKLLEHSELHKLTYKKKFKEYQKKELTNYGYFIK